MSTAGCESRMVPLFDNTPDSSVTGPGPFLWHLRGFVVGILFLSIPVAILNQSEFTGDPAIYRSRMIELFQGSLPYIDFPYEHLPLSLVPMALAWILGGVISPLLYTVVFACLMAVCLAVTTELLKRIEDVKGPSGATLRWLVVSTPLFPIVLFRSDPVPLLLAVATIYTMAIGREKATLSLELAGILTKGWPALYAIPEWSRGRRVRAVVLAVVTVSVVAALVILPGFSQTRAASGLHSESIVGSVVAAVRTMRGESLGLLYQAGATYIDVPLWAWVLNLNLGAGLGLLTFARFRPDPSFNGIAPVMAALIVALLVASPLLSPQFLLWPTPFLALHRSNRVQWTALLVTGLTLVYMMGWNSNFVGNPWWLYVLNVRNLALVVLGALCAWTVGSKGNSRPQPQGAIA